MAFSGSFRADEKAQSLDDFELGISERQSMPRDNAETKSAPAILLYDSEGVTKCVGSINPDPSGRLTDINLEAVHEEDRCGFRLKFACYQLDAHRPLPSSSACHDLLFQTRWACRFTKYHSADNREKSIIMSLSSSKVQARLFFKKALHCLRFANNGNDYPFVFKDLQEPCRHRDHCHSQHMVASLANGKNFRLFLQDQQLIAGFKTWAANSNLATLSGSPYQNLVSLPETALRQWRGNVQNCIASGLADLPSAVFFDNTLVNGAKTTFDLWPLASSVQHFLNQKYKGLNKEPPGNAYPLFLDITYGKISGERYINIDNVTVGISLIQEMLQSLPLLRPSDIGIITIYGSQAKAYSRVLDSLDRENPRGRYTEIRIGTVEWWLTRRAEILLFDMVQIGTDRRSISEYLSQRVRLQVALTTHRQGLVIIGTMKCLNNVSGWRGQLAERTLAEQNKTLREVFMWLSDKGRIVSLGCPPESNDALSSQIRCVFV